MIDRKQHAWVKGLPILGLIWLVGAMGDRLWFALDHDVPAWDQADYLTGALNYWQALQSAQWGAPDWWVRFWQLSTKIPPLVYISTSPLLSLLGQGVDQSTAINLVYSAILLGSVYGLGVCLFSVSVGLWAAVFCLLMPGLYRVRLDFLLDFPLATMVTLCFTCLTLWREQSIEARQPGVSKGIRSVRKQARAEEVEPNQDVKDDSGQSQEGQLKPTGEIAAEIAAETAAETTAKIDETKDEREKDQVKDREYAPLENKAPQPHRDKEEVPESEPTAPVPFLAVALELANTFRSWLLAIAIGLTLGLALMTKQPAILFLAIPIAAAVVETFWRWQWVRLLQLILAIALAIPIFGGWYRTNWLLMLSATKRATVDSAIAEGDPSLLSLDAWTLYLRLLPKMVSLPLLVVGLTGVVFFWRRSRVSSQWYGERDYAPMSRAYRQRRYGRTQRSLYWLGLFLLAGYLLSSLNLNKDDRYVVPYLPVLAIVLAYGFTLLPQGWKLLRWGAVSLAVLLMGLNLLPLGLPATATHNALAYHPPYLGQPYPHAEVVADVIKAEPYLRSTIGVLPSTPAINQHNVNYYGNLRNFQVYGRQVGTRNRFVQKDGRSLSWFLTKTGSQGSIGNPTAQTAINQMVEQGNEFSLYDTWQLPDASNLNLWRRRVPPVQVKSFELDPAPTAVTKPIKALLSPIQLNAVLVPDRVPPGQPVPVSYTWSGSWKALQSGLVILTWRRQEPENRGKSRWFHDHGIGMGSLHSSEYEAFANLSFQVTEQSAMLPPANATPGTYTLDAIYVNRKTGKSEAIAVPPVQLQIDPTAAPVAAPELDLVTQLRSLAATLPQGRTALDRVFDEIGRMNQYDPLQDYVDQTRQAMTYRLQQEPKNRIFAYTLALTQVLKRRVEPAIAALQEVTRLDPSNPAPYAYLAFVNLYDFRPQAAQMALTSALKLAPQLPELHALSGIAALMQGHFRQAWQEVQQFRQLSRV